VTCTVTAATSRDPAGPDPGPTLRPMPGAAGHAPDRAGRWGSGRRPASAPVAVATGLLFLLGVGLFAVSLNAQYRYVLHAKHRHRTLRRPLNLVTLSTRSLSTLSGMRGPTP
jgi:hypothetical protein